MTFARRTYERKPQPLYRPMERTGSYAAPAAAVAVQKERVARSEAYRRAVAALPCKNCGLIGSSQAAHPNTGKGMGIKTDDRLCFALCVNCHIAFDQKAIFSKEARRLIEQAWGADTRRQIIAAGEWPENLQLWTEA